MLCCTVPDIVELFEGDLRVMATDLTGARKSLVARASSWGSLHNHEVCACTGCAIHPKDPNIGKVLAAILLIINKIVHQIFQVSH